MESHDKTVDTLKDLNQEVQAIEAKVDRKLSEKDISSSEADNWIYQLNKLIRQVDHIVEKLESIKK
jgi:soluble cytochrome b562